MKKKESFHRKLTIGLFVVYVILLIWIILFKMQLSFDTLPNFRGLNLIPFAGTAIRNNQLDYREILLNLLVFIPFGLYISMIKPDWKGSKLVFISASVSLLFEVVQYLFAIGGADITDLISNSLGGLVGIGIYKLSAMILKERVNRILNIVALIGTICFVLLGIIASRFITYRL